MSPDDKVAKVMREFEAGTLKSSSGEVVTSREQELAIAMSQSGQSNKDSSWVTVGSNENRKGSKVLISENGTILGGMGGKFTGKKINNLHGKSDISETIKSQTANAAQLKSILPSSEKPKTDLSQLKSLKKESHANYSHAELSNQIESAVRSLPTSKQRSTKRAELATHFVNQMNTELESVKSNINKSRVNGAETQTLREMNAVMSRLEHKRDQLRESYNV